MKRVASKLKQLSTNWEFILFLLVLSEIVIFSAKNQKFLLPRVLFGSMNDIISICIISLFVTFVMITGGIDIQVGSIVGLTSIIIGVAWQDGGLDIWAACLLAILAAALCGTLSAIFIAYYNVQPMVVTLGGSFLYAGVARMVSNFSATASYKGISGFPNSFRSIGKTKLFGFLPGQVILFLVLAILAYILLHKTKYGRRIFLIGVNAKAAGYSGIKTKFIVLTTYVLSAVSAAFAGIVLTAYLGTAKSDLGSNLTLPIITAVVLGGTSSNGGKGNVIGTALAAIAIGLLRFGLPLCFGISQQYLEIPVGLLLLLVITARALWPKVYAHFQKRKTA
ncbi:MAG: ABC transporter permease [Fusobacteriaceae bacterium]|jgi:AI-2 transport system permease protein|nr:ABC transporter permease [Fusobacteriaceae bacterium]